MKEELDRIRENLTKGAAYIYPDMRQDLIYLLSAAQRFEELIGQPGADDGSVDEKVFRILESELVATKLRLKSFTDKYHEVTDSYNTLQKWMRKTYHLSGDIIRVIEKIPPDELDRLLTEYGAEQ